MDEFHLPNKPFRGYDAVVSNNSGDFNSLCAALAVAQAGWTIFVAPGSYNEDGIKAFAIPNVTIIGSGPESTKCNFGGNTFAAAAAATYLKIQGIGFTANSATNTTLFSYQGANTELINCHYTNNGLFGTLISGGGSDLLMQGCVATNNSTSIGTQAFLFSAASARISGNVFKYNPTYTSATNGMIQFSGAFSVISGNTFQYLTSGAQNDVEVSGDASAFTGNQINHTGGGNAALLLQGLDSATVSNNTIYASTIDFPLLLNTASISTSISGNSILTTGAHGIYLANAAHTHVSITGNSVSTPTTTCIRVATSSTNIEVSGNSVSGNAKGIDFNTGTFLSAVGNSVKTTGSSNAIDFEQNSNMSAIGNVITGPSGATGINVSSDYSTICDNLFDTTIGTPISIVTTKKGVTAKNNVGQSAITSRVSIYCKNTSGSTINQGAVVIRKLSVAAGNEITTTTTASDVSVLGVADESIANNASGYVCVEGKTIYLKVDGTTDIAIGDYLSTFTTAEIAQKATAGTLGTTPGHLAFAIALEAYTANDSSGIIDALILPAPIRL